MEEPVNNNPAVETNIPETNPVVAAEPALPTEPEPVSIAQSLGTTVPPQVPEPTFVSVPPSPPAPRVFNFKKILLTVLSLLIMAILGVVVIKILPTMKLAPVTLTYWGLWETDQVIKPIIADFEKNNARIKINYIRQSPKQYRERLASSLARGEGPDIFRFHNSWVPMFSRELAPLPKTIASELQFSRNFYPVVSQDLGKNGDYYGIPLEIDGLGLYVNEEIFRAAGATYPTSWQELEDVARRLTVRDQAGIIRTSGLALGITSNVEHWSDVLALMMLQNGVDPANPTGKLAEDALVYFNSFARGANNTWDETLDNSILAFAKGQVAMIFAPSWQVFEIKNINPELSFKILPMPQLPGVNVSWASYWAEGVWQKSKNKTEAFEFLKYLAGREVMTKLYAEEAKVRLFGEPYARVDLGQTLLADPYVGAFISQAPNAKSFYMCSRTFDNGINDKIIKYFEDAVNSLDKGVSAAAALETASQGISQVLSTYSIGSSAPSQ